MLKKAIKHAAKWTAGLSPRQITAILVVFAFTALGAGLMLRACRWWNRGRLIPAPSP